MIIGVEWSKIKKQKSIKEWIYFYYDKDSYLELLLLLKKQKEKYLNLDLLDIDISDNNENIKLNNNENIKIIIWKLSVKNLWLWYDLYPDLTYFLVCKEVEEK